MRINDINSSQKTNQSKRKAKAGVSNGDGVFSQVFGTESQAQEQSPEIQNIVNIQSVLSIDSIGLLAQSNNQDLIKQQNIGWGKDVLKNLESLRYQILNGKISYNSLLQLKERLNNIPIHPGDIKLNQIIQEIEIRAAVEIEKLNKLTNQNEV